MDLSFSRFLLLFLRIGNLTFGGGDPTMAAFQYELVARRQLLSPQRYGLIYGLARVTPGTNLLAFCAGIGYELFGFRGALAAVAAVTLPTAVLVVLFTFAYETWSSNPLAMAAIGGMLAAAVGMMAAAAWGLSRPHWKPGGRLRTVALTGAALLLSRFAGLSPVPILLLGALAGLVWRDPSDR